MLIQTTNPQIGPSFVFDRYIVCSGLYAIKNEILSWLYVACTLGSLYGRNQLGQKEMLMCSEGLYHGARVDTEEQKIPLS